MQLNIAIFVTSLVMLLMLASVVTMGDKLNTVGTFAFVLSVFGLVYSIVGFF